MNININDSIGISQAKHRLKLTPIFLMLITSVVGCNSEDSSGGIPLVVSDVNYIRTATEFGPVFLEASPRHGPLLIGGEFIEFEPIENVTIAWQFSDEETLQVRSQSSFQSELNLVVLADDGLMQVAMVNDDSVSTEFADWRFIPLDNGRCHLVNDALGTELVLSAVNPRTSGVNIVRYEVEMAAVDDSVVQEWSVVRVGNPAGQFEPACVEEL